MAVARMAALRDIRIKYKQSILGPVWLVVQPLGLLAALLVAFSGIAHVSTKGVSSLLFTIVGVTVWTFVQQCITVGSNAMISNATLVRRSTCPRAALVMGSMMANLPALAVMLGLSLILTFFIEGIGPQVVVTPLLVVWLMVLLLGPVLLLAGIATRFRDAIAVIPMLMQAGVFLTPVGYSTDSAPETLRIALTINPITGMIEVWRWAMLGIPPSLLSVALCGFWTVVLALFGWYVFSRLETGFADYL